MVLEATFRTCLYTASTYALAGRYSPTVQPFYPTLLLGFLKIASEALQNFLPRSFLYSIPVLNLSTIYIASIYCNSQQLPALSHLIAFYRTSTLVSALFTDMRSISFAKESPGWSPLFNLRSTLPSPIKQEKKLENRGPTVVEHALFVSITTSIAYALVPRQFSTLDRKTTTALVGISSLIQNFFTALSFYYCNPSRYYPIYTENENTKSLTNLKNLLFASIALITPYVVHQIGLQLFNNTPSYFEMLAVLSTSGSLARFAIETTKSASNFFQKPTK